MTEKTSTKISFLISAIFGYVVFIIALAGAQDILAGTHIQTSTILLADMLPFLFIALLFPYIARRIPYIVRFIFVIFLLLVAFSILGFVNNVNWKVCAVALASCGNGILIVSFLGLTTYFQPEVLSWFSMGTGLGGLIGFLYYTAFTTWFYLSSQITLFTPAPCSMIVLVCYYFIQKDITVNEQQRNGHQYHQLESDEFSSDKEQQFVNSVKNEKENELVVLDRKRQGEKKTTIEENSDEQKENISSETEKEKGTTKAFYLLKKKNDNEKKEKAPNSESKKQRSMLFPWENENKEKEALLSMPNKKKMAEIINKQDKDNIQTFDNKDTLTVKEKLAAVKRLVTEVGFAGLTTTFFKYTAFQSVITTLAYQSSPFPPRDHFQYYSLALMLGETLGRSHRTILAQIKPNCLYTPTRFLLYSLASLELSHLVILFLESWYRFFPGISIPIILCFSCGFVAGIMFVNFMEWVRCSFTGQVREFAMLMAHAPIDSGIVIASLLGLFVEPILKHHCIETKALSVYCFTRSFNL